MTTSNYIYNQNTQQKFWIRETIDNPFLTPQKGDFIKVIASSFKINYQPLGFWKSLFMTPMEVFEHIFSETKYYIEGEVDLITIDNTDIDGLTQVLITLANPRHKII